MQGINPRRPQDFGDVIFQHAEKGLIGVAHPPLNAGGSVTVQMGPGASIRGRLVGAGGQPRAGVQLEVEFRKKDQRPVWRWARYPPGRIKTDREGRFRVNALLPGYEFRLSDGNGVLPFGGGTLGAGQARNLGDVTIKADAE